MEDLSSGAVGLMRRKLEVLFDPGTGEGFFEHGGLENLQAGEIIFAVHIVDISFAGFDSAEL